MTFSLTSWLAIGGGLIIAGQFALLQLKDTALQEAREDKGRFEALYTAETETSQEWKAFAETQSAAAQEAARREGAAAQAESERQSQLSGAWATINRLERQANDRLEPACGGMVLRDADANQLYRDTLSAVANSTTTGAAGPDLLAGPGRLERVAGTAGIAAARGGDS